MLLILAGVAINLSVGSNGIFTRAKNSTEKYKQASNDEKDEMQNAINFIDDYLQGNGNVDDKEEQEPIVEGSILDEYVKGNLK